MSKVAHVLKETILQWKVVFIVYISQFFFGLILAYSMYAEMYTSYDGSLALEYLAKGFDRTVFMDMVNSQNEMFSSSRGLAIILLIVYCFMSVLLQGGWLYTIRKKEFSIRSFLRGGWKYYFPFLGFAGISLLLFLLFGGGVGYLFTSWVGDPLMTFSSEKPYVLWIIFLVCLYALWTILVWSWSVTARLHYINQPSFIKAVKLGFDKVKQNLGKYIAIGWLIIGIHVFLMFLYYWIMGDRGASSWYIVAVGIIFQQTIAYSRVLLRGFSYSLVEDLNPIPTE
ncbi:MAG: hypothetical protein P1U56_04960 [Saprospiraceae bacterium]|nr:hypothetical protein [Saprospiraceae bacterium]